VDETVNARSFVQRAHAFNCQAVNRRMFEKSADRPAAARRGLSSAARCLNTIYGVRVRANGYEEGCFPGEVRLVVYAGDDVPGRPRPRGDGELLNRGIRAATNRGS
jgi:hypothetical protein